MQDEQLTTIPAQTSAFNRYPKLKFALYLLGSLLFLSVLIASAVLLVLMLCGVIYLTPVVIGICATLFLLGMNAKAWHSLSDSLSAAWQEFIGLKPIQPLPADNIMTTAEQENEPIVDELEENALVIEPITPYSNAITGLVFQFPIDYIPDDIHRSFLFPQLPHRDLMQLRGVNREYRRHIDYYILYFETPKTVFSEILSRKNQSIVQHLIDKIRIDKKPISFKQANVSGISPNYFLLPPEYISLEGACLSTNHTSASEKPDNYVRIELFLLGLLNFGLNGLLLKNLLKLSFMPSLWNDISNVPYEFSLLINEIDQLQTGFYLELLYRPLDEAFRYVDMDETFRNEIFLQNLISRLHDYYIGCLGFDSKDKLYHRNNDFLEHCLLYQLNCLPDANLRKDIFFISQFNEENLTFCFWVCCDELNYSTIDAIEKWQEMAEKNAGAYYQSVCLEKSAFLEQLNQHNRSKLLRNDNLVPKMLFCIPTKTVLQCFLVNPVFITIDLFYNHRADYLVAPSKETCTFLSNELEKFGGFTQGISDNLLESLRTAALTPQVHKKMSNNSKYIPDCMINMFTNLCVISKLATFFLKNESDKENSLLILADILTQPVQTIQITQLVLYFCIKDKNIDEHTWYQTEPGKRIIAFAKDTLFREVDRLSTPDAKIALLEEMQQKPLFRHETSWVSKGVVLVTTFFSDTPKEKTVLDEIEEKIALIKATKDHMISGQATL